MARRKGFLRSIEGALVPFRGRLPASAGPLRTVGSVNVVQHVLRVAHTNAARSHCDFRPIGAVAVRIQRYEGCL